MGDVWVFDPSSTCPKCGAGEVSTVYQRSGHCESYGGGGCAVARMFRDPDCCRTTSEHIHRTCQRCRYWWPELVLPAPAVASSADATDEGGE